MGAKQKFYVVWEGTKPGIYTTWKDCEKQVAGVKAAKYKSFETLEEAEQAFRAGHAEYYRQHPTIIKPKVAPMLFGSDVPGPIQESLAVDAAWNTKTKEMEYRGVYTKTGREVFHQGPFKRATNNVGEFLAIVHGLALLKKKNIDMPIYTDSMTALSWVRKKKHNSVILPTEENEKVITLLENAENWLRNNTYTTQILKWNTPVWGEIPADFGRK